MIFGSNAKLSKKINRELVLKTIYNNKPISRADIAKITGLTPASITKIIEEFRNIGLVSEIGNDLSKVGRKPILIDINKDDFYIIGLYIARKSISGIITNLNAEIIEKIQYKENYLNQPDLINKVADLINKLLENSKIDKSKVLGIGMAVPGPINAKKGEFLDKGLNEKPPYNWGRLPLAEKVAEERKDAENIAAASMIDNVVDCKEDVIGKVDAAIIGEDMGAAHLVLVRPFIEKDILIFICLKKPGDFINFVRTGKYPYSYELTVEQIKVVTAELKSRENRGRHIFIK